MPLQATSGAASYDAFGGGVPVVPNYIEDVFSTYLYDGGYTGAINNGIDLSTKGGLVWLKFRSGTATETNHELYDTARGSNYFLVTNNTAAQVFDGSSLNSFNTNGFSIQTDPGIDAAGSTYASWTFREQPKFFDVVTYTGNGLDRTIAHNLGSVPGCIIVKCTSSGGSATYNWVMWHRSLASNEFLQLNTTDQKFSGASVFNTTSVPNTSTTFSVGTNAITNQSGQTYIAYIFAHNAGGFGLTGTDNVISCGSFTTDGSGNATVSLGYEPQWVLVKRTNTVESWQIIDNMRGWPVTPVAGNYAKKLIPNSTAAEADTGEFPLTNTGFNATGIGASNTYIYIAIRRGPMKVPTSGTSVFSPAIRTGTGSSVSLTSAGFPPDLYLPRRRDTSSGSNYWWDRLRGSSVHLASDNTNAEVSGTRLTSFNQTGVTLGSLDPNASGSSYVDWYLRRAPSFFDEVCYTGTGSARTITHNLGAVPELMIVKRRDAAANWPVYTASTATNEYLFLNSGGLPTTATTVWNNTAPTSSVFSVGTSALTNASAGTYVAYLFSSCAGVSKVGSYTGTGALQTINCGFTSGARFVLIKLISSGTSGSGDWYVWDSARGISSGNDPYLLLDSTSAEVTGTNYVDTDTTGFKVTAAGATDINASGDVYLFLAIA